jgi:hypothetical protein
VWPKKQGVGPNKIGSVKLHLSADSAGGYPSYYNKMGRLMTSKRRFIVCCVGELVGETAVFACQSNKSRVYPADYEHLLREMIFLLDLLLKECMLYLSNFLFRFVSASAAFKKEV